MSRGCSGRICGGRFVVLIIARRRQLANRKLPDIVAAWEHEHGAFSGDEPAAARALVDG